MALEINKARWVTLPRAGRVPVGKVLCIGRNYAKHAAEMNSPVPESPLVFLKPATSLTASGSTVDVPEGLGSVHHEVEMVVLVGSPLKHATEQQAREAIAGLAVGLDMTARDVQARAKQAGHPWSVAKGYDSFAPVGTMAPPGETSRRRITLEINGKTVQDGTTSDMIFGVPQLLAYSSRIFTLEPGDLLFTGTPEGVGPVHPGDVLIARIDGLPELQVSVRSVPA
ncbi:MAG: fumarylacetoacetate hydrolase family protein [Rhodothermales bacterium]|nr:fumarylacetoacetate hydrolase family protein [Rhodothermales bacterium]MBO6780492.1 fumarylacetoacetate hydrolase family protein [Rhodothermales bacterium]